MRRVALLDAGAQLERVIMRRVIEQGYSVDKFPVDVSPKKIQDYDAIIISGGPRSINDNGALLPNPQIYGLGKPILGICYGLQAIAHQLGGKVIRGEKGQYGRSTMRVSNPGPLFAGFSSNERVLMSHFDTVETIPDNFVVYGTSEGLIAAIGNESKRIYATQFHPELIPVTRNGNQIFENFFRNVCGFPPSERRTIEEDIQAARKIITDSVGTDNHVMHYLSGGVDSTVMALLLSESVEPERLHMRTLDTGTMRLEEIDEVRQMASQLNLPNFSVLDVKDMFYGSNRTITTDQGEVLAGPLYDTIDPEIKRKLFGTEYAAIALSEMARISHESEVPLDRFLLGQGTLRPDAIESGDSRVTKGNAHTIKTHHNAVDALRNIPKIEPLIDLFKDQVRQIALEFGLDESFAYRQPSPGPGLYCRIIGSRSKGGESPSFFQVNHRIGKAAREYGFDAHALPIRTVGVQGDERSYKYPAIVSGKVDWEQFSSLVFDLPNEVSEVNRVLYTPGEALSLEDVVSLTPTLMTQDVIQQSQEADLVMRTVAERYGFNDSRRCSQMPGILIPCDLGNKGQRSFVVRPIWTHDFMAVLGMMPSSDNPPCYEEGQFPEEMFFEMADEIPRKVDGISRVILDISDKPPASTEWE